MSVSERRGTLVLRRPRTWWSLPVAFFLWLAGSAVDVFWLDAVTFTLCMGIVLFEAILYPPWIRVDARGVTVCDVLQRRTFPWSTIERFAVGDPCDPKFAYLIYKEPNGTAPFALPDLVDPEPAEVVRLLSVRQKSFRRTASAPVS